MVAPMTESQQLRVQPAAGLSSPVAMQERALIDCHSRQGVAAALMVETLTTADGSQYVVAVPANGLSPAAADRLNQCAAGLLGGAAPAYPVPVNARDRAMADLARPTSTPDLAYGCSVDTSVLRGGVAYCPKGAF